MDYAIPSERHNGVHNQESVQMSPDPPPCMGGFGSGTRQCSTVNQDGGHWEQSQDYYTYSQLCKLTKHSCPDHRAFLLATLSECMHV